ncbi:MAG: flagellar cap protein FliD N-terminal domain-containing protein, partial [Candidatus Poribacteria bacterium]|nr:flagellar cap protein FliD N-terminal domain-containing protein [Candidatus Poribacteria bacterium]
MSLQATGLVSGFDVNSIIDDLIRAESAPRSRLENREKILNAQQDTLKTINSNLLVLQSRATGLASNTLTLQRMVTSTNEDALEATATSGAPRQDYQLDVSSLATSSRVSSDSSISNSIELGRLVEISLEKDSDNDGLLDQGSFTVDGLTKDSSGNDITITLDQGSTTLDSIVSTLNFTATDSTTTSTNHTTLFESSYIGASDDSGLSITKRISK